MGSQNVYNEHVLEYLCYTSTYCSEYLEYTFFCIIMYFVCHRIPTIGHRNVSPHVMYINDAYFFSSDSRAKDTGTTVPAAADSGDHVSTAEYLQPANGNLPRMA